MERYMNKAIAHRPPRGVDLRRRAAFPEAHQGDWQP